MKTVLRKIQKEQKNVCIYIDEDNPNRFVFGKIIGMDENCFAVLMVSPDGNYDGVLIKQIRDIVYIEYSYSYEIKMNTLMKIRNYRERDYSFISRDILQESLLWAQKSKKIISIELNHSGTNDVVGFVAYMCEGLCTITKVDELGEIDGEAFCVIRDISQICIDSADERRISDLYDTKMIDCREQKSGVS